MACVKKDGCSRKWEELRLLIGKFLVNKKKKKTYLK